jgi:drug/metabolite transporter (DMT)-like permease
MTSDVSEVGSHIPPRVTAGTNLQVWVPLISLWLLWGSTYLAIAVSGETFAPLLANGVRFLFSAAILGTIMVLAKGPAVLRITRSELAYSALMGVMLLAVGIGTISLAEQYVPSGIVALLVSVNALWIVLLRMRAGDRPARRTVAGVAIGLLGLGVMLLPGGTEPKAGTDVAVVLWSAAILVSSFIWSYFSFRSTGYTLPRNALTTTFYELVAGGFALLAFGALHGDEFDLAAVDSSAWISLGWLVFASIVGYSSYSWLLNKAPLSLLSTYAYINPVVAVFLGWLILGEPLSRDVIIGLTVVLGSVILVINGERRNR